MQPTPPSRRSSPPTAPRSPFAATWPTSSTSSGCSLRRSTAFGGVDVVVHAVGQISLGPAPTGGLDTFDAPLPTSVLGTFVVNRQAARELRDGGAIVNIFGSVVGLARPTRAATPPSQDAAEAITRVVANELHGRDITVNAVVLELERPASSPNSSTSLHSWPARPATGSTARSSGSTAGSSEHVTFVLNARVGTGRACTGSRASTRDWDQGAPRVRRAGERIRLEQRP